MTGEMSRAEVTRDAYPDLFALRDALHRRGIPSEPRPFDQYQGPYLNVPTVGCAWYSDHPEVWRSTGRPILPFVIESGNRFEYIGADHAHAETEELLHHGCYTLRQAARRIATLYRIVP